MPPLLSSRHITPHSRLKNNASVTIIIFTSTYVLFNVPACVQYLLYLVTLYRPGAGPYPGLLFSSPACILTFVLCVALNATVNLFIYLARICSFREHVICGAGDARAGLRQAAVMCAAGFRGRESKRFPQTTSNQLLDPGLHVQQLHLDLVQAIQLQTNS